MQEEQHLKSLRSGLMPFAPMGRPCRRRCRWDGNNGPEQTDYLSVRNLVHACPKSLKRFVLTTSAGVERYNQLPFSILNLFGACQLLPL